MQHPTETWKPIEGYEGIYEISDHGRVKSLARGRMLTIPPNKGGYRCVRLSKRGRGESRRVHRLVAEAFVSGWADGLEVRHLDGNKLNNTAANLAWGTRSENMRDLVEHGNHSMANKTHCPKGHEYTPENVYIRKGTTSRHCRQCSRDRINARYAEHRAAGRSPAEAGRKTPRVWARSA